jgi:CTP synthase
MHALIVAFARTISGLDDAHSTEFAPETGSPVVDRTPASDPSGLRLGTVPCRLVPGTKAAAAYFDGLSYERHRHSHELNSHYRACLRNTGLIPSGLSADDQFVDIVEVQEHAWMVGCQFHAEFKSRPDRPHPLFVAFLAAAQQRLLEGAQPTLPIT